MAYLPAHNSNAAATRLLAFDVGPGMRLLDLLAQRLTAGEHPFDPGGRLAVQGVQLPELIEHWLNDPYFRMPLPRWQPRGVRPERFLADAMHLAVEHGWSVRLALHGHAFRPNCLPEPSLDVAGRHSPAKSF